MIDIGEISTEIENAVKSRDRVRLLSIQTTLELLSKCAFAHARALSESDQATAKAEDYLQQAYETEYLPEVKKR
jgi:hypothetical protein